MSIPRRPLLAATSSSGSNDPAQNIDAQQPVRSKRTLIESACSACRRRKSKCDGIRPSCSRCRSLRSECTFEAEEGESRWSALRRKNEALELERADVRELLSLVTSSDGPEALEIFKRMRDGVGYEDVSEILRQVRDGELPCAIAEQRLPSFRTMFEASGATQYPPPVPQFVAHSSSASSGSSSVETPATTLPP